MKPWHFFEAFVVWNHLDCLNEPGDIRRAFNAAVSASHFADHYFCYNKRHDPQLVSNYPNIGAMIESWSNSTAGDFGDIRSIANAYKHLYTDASSKLGQYANVDSSGSIERIKLPAKHGVVGMAAGILEEGEVSRWQVIYTRRNGAAQEFLPVLTRVVDWIQTNHGSQA